MSKSLSLNLALAHMRSGATMILTHEPTGDRYRINPGGAVDNKVACEIKAHPSVIGCGDGLWPGHDQAWRIADRSRAEVA